MFHPIWKEGREGGRRRKERQRKNIEGRKTGRKEEVQEAGMGGGIFFGSG